MLLSEAVDWLVFTQDIDPYEDLRFTRAALLTGREYVHILNFAICYNVPSVIQSRYKLLQVRHAAYDKSYSTSIQNMYNDPYLPREGWMRLLISNDRKRLLTEDYKLYLELDRLLAKAIPYDIG